MMSPFIKQAEDFLNTLNFKDDHAPNYIGWEKEYKNVRLCICVDINMSFDTTFTVSTCKPKYHSGSDPRGENEHMFHDLYTNINLERLTYVITFLETTLDKK